MTPSRGMLTPSALDRPEKDFSILHGTASRWPSENPKWRWGDGVRLNGAPSDPVFLYILFDFSFIVCNFVERKP